MVRARKTSEAQASIDAHMLLTRLDTVSLPNL